MNTEIEIAKKTKIKLIVIAVLVFLFSMLGVTYAYFGLMVEGNETASHVLGDTADMRLEYTDVQLLMKSSAFPGWSATKTFTVENTGNDTVLYNFVWRELYNTIQNGDLVIRATCSSTAGSCANLPEKEVSYTSTQVTNSYIHGPFSIAPDEVQTYTLTVEYKETGSNQGYNKGASFHGTINIAEGAEEHPLYNVLKTMAQEGTYAGTYSGTSNDSYGRTGNKTIYYIKTSSSNNTTQANELINNKINVKFAGFCWQMLRTTDTGGVKLIYNGEPDGSGYCLRQDTEATHLGIVGTDGTSGDMTGNYMYSDTFTYDTSTNPGTFTLVNPVVSNWSTNKNLVGKYTCKTSSSTSTCSTLYYVNIKYNTTANNAYYTTYTIGNTQNAQIGISTFNADRKSPAYVGYMFGDAYEYASSSAPASGSIMGNTVYWNGNNYELRESDGTTTSTGTEYNNTHHYTCNTASATCTDGKVRYYFFNNYYYVLKDGEKIEDALSKMLTNKYDSAIKSYLENWYYNNIYRKTSEVYIEQDAVYCNDRSISSLGGWSKDGNKGGAMAFNNYNIITSLECANNTDKFSTSNSSAQLKYPIGIVDTPEMQLIDNSTLRETNQEYWLLSPRSTNYYASVRVIYTGGLIDTRNTSTVKGIRPVITLAPTNVPVTGSGSLTDPYVIN